MFDLVEKPQKKYYCFCIFEVTRLDKFYEKCLWYQSILNVPLFNGWSFDFYNFQIIKIQIKKKKKNFQIIGFIEAHLGGSGTFFIKANVIQLFKQCVCVWERTEWEGRWTLPSCCTFYFTTSHFYISRPDKNSLKFFQKFLDRIKQNNEH